MNGEGAQVKAPIDLVADVHGLLLAATEAMQKIAAAADAVNACVVELEADADKATAQDRAANIRATLPKRKVPNNMAAIINVQI